MYVGEWKGAEWVRRLVLLLDNGGRRMRRRRGREVMVMGDER
jgi:hypothetical protein